MITTKGIVIGERSIGEQDKYIDILTEDYGIIEVRAKASKKLTAKAFAACNIYTYSQYCLREYKGKYYIDSTKHLMSFFSVATDIEKFALVNYFTDILKNVTADTYEARQLLHIFIDTLYCIELNMFPIKQIKAVFEFLVMAQVGYEPDLGVCKGCGSEIAYYFSVEDACLYCEKCKPQNAIEVPIPTLIALRYISVTELKKVFMFKLKDEKYVDILGQITQKYVFYHLDMSFKSLDYYYKVKSKG